MIYLIILAHLFLLLADLKDIWVSQAFAQCAHVMCEGEMKQIEKRSDFMMEDAEYFTIIHRKTAALFQAACTGGAYFSGAPLDVIEALGVGRQVHAVVHDLERHAESETIGTQTLDHI